MVVTSSCPDETAREYPSRRWRAQQRREHRPRVGDQGDRPGRQRVALEVADRAHAAGDVDEAHAAGAAHLQPVGRGDQLVAHARARRRRRPRRRRRAAGGQPRAGRRSAASGTPSSTRSTGSGTSASDGRHGRPSTVAYRGLTRCTRVERRGCAAPRWSSASRSESGSLAGADDRDRPAPRASGQPRADRRQGVGRSPSAAQRRSSRRRSAGARPCVLAAAARAACMPGMPQTPPPAWVAEPAL